MKINEPVIVFDGESGEILTIGTLEAIDLEYFWTTYTVDGTTFETGLSIGTKPKFVVISEERHKELIRHCANKYVDYISKLTRYMFSHVNQDDFDSVISSLNGIEDLLDKRVKEMKLEDEIDRVKRIWNLTSKRPEQYDITDEVNSSELKHAAEAIGKRIK